MATNMSVEDMNALLSELGVQTEVKVEEVKTTRNVPVYRTEMTNVQYDDYDNIIGYDMTTTSQGTTPMEEIIEVAQIGAEGEVDPPKVTFSGRGSASQSAVESGSSSGSSSKTSDSRQKKSDMVDRYKEVNDELEETNRLIDKNSTLSEGMWGKDKINMMKQNVNLMKQENEQLKKKADLAAKYLKEDRAELESAATEAGVNFTFNEINLGSTDFLYEWGSKKDKRRLATFNFCIGKRGVNDLSTDNSTECSVISFLLKKFTEFTIWAVIMRRQGVNLGNTAHRCNK